MASAAAVSSVSSVAVFPGRLSGSQRRLGRRTRSRRASFAVRASAEESSQGQQGPSPSEEEEEEEKPKEVCKKCNGTGRIEWIGSKLIPFATAYRRCDCGAVPASKGQSVDDIFFGGGNSTENFLKGKF
eukprot:jgi/Chlat1/5707/Chrsp38S05548